MGMKGKLVVEYRKLLLQAVGGNIVLLSYICFTFANFVSLMPNREICRIYSCFIEKVKSHVCSYILCIQFFSNNSLNCKLTYFVDRFCLSEYLT